MAVKLRGESAVDLIGLKELAEAAECLKTLAHPVRLRMVQMLLDGHYTVGELAEACGIASPMASGHLRLLERCGLLSHERHRREVFYHVAQPCLREIMTCIEKTFSPSGRSESSAACATRVDDEQAARGEEASQCSPPSPDTLLNDTEIEDLPLEP
jgi:ArsR family transcriptional regulator, zinc-responsive transcriptional repressor